MRIGRVAAAALVAALAACGGGDEGEGGGADTTAAVPASSPAPAPPAGTADTAGMGVSPPTAGGQVVDSAAVPGAADTTAGTPTAP